jgi:hypothetical protein
LHESGDEGDRDFCGREAVGVRKDVQMKEQRFLWLRKRGTNLILNLSGNKTLYEMLRCA